MTLPGTVAAVELLDSETAAPPAGAAALKVTVPVEALPLTTLVGLSDSAESVGPPGGLTTSVALFIVARIPEIVAVVDTVTVRVVTVKVALLAPAATVTLAGTVIAAVLPASGTTAPPVGAAALNVTVPDDEVPPATLVGLNVSAASVGPVTAGVRVSIASRLGSPGTPKDAMMVASTVPVTALVVIVKLALVANAGTVMLAGTATTAGRALMSVMSWAWLCAALKVTVPVVALPPIRLVGLSASVASSGCGGAATAVTVRSAVRVTTPKPAKIVTVLEAVTAALVGTVKAALVAPTGTVTVPGTFAVLKLLLDSETTAPPLGAAAVKVTVPVDELPAATVVGLSVSVARAGPAPTGVISKSASRLVMPATFGKSAVMFRLNCPVTADVAIVKLALVAPAGTVTFVQRDGGGGEQAGMLAGRVAGAVSMIETRTTVALLCWALKVTVTVAELPPTTLVGLTDAPESSGAGGGTSTVRMALKL